MLQLLAPSLRHQVRRRYRSRCLRLLRKDPAPRSQFRRRSHLSQRLDRCYSHSLSKGLEYTIEYERTQQVLGDVYNAEM